LEMVPTIGFNVGDHLLKKIRSALIVSAAKFMEANPDAPLVHIAKKKSERRKARRRTKRAPQISAGRQSS
jgi:hypothetical protein